MKIKLPSFLNGEYIASGCGHKTKLKGRVVSAFGYEHILIIPKNESGSTDWCLRCISKMSIRCAWCKNIIFIGSPITLYTPKSKDFQVPEHAVIYNKVPLTLVGCLDLGCAHSLDDQAGFWLPGENGEGCIHRVPTVYDLSAITGGDGEVSNIYHINGTTFPSKSK